EELRRAYSAAWAERHGTVVAEAPLASAAGAWAVDDGNDRFVHDPRAAARDEAAAADPHRQQLQRSVARNAAELVERAESRGERLGNMPTWKRLPGAARAFTDLVAGAPAEIPHRLGEAYGWMLELAGFL